MKEITVSDYIENFLYSSELAQSRIKEEGRLYRINSVSDLILKQGNFEDAEEQHAFESSLVRDENGNFTEAGIFRGIVYSLLTPMQNYSTQMNVFDAILSEGFDMPEKILDSKAALCKAIIGANYHDEKANYIYELAEKWDYPSIYRKIIRGIKSGKEKEISLRDELVTDVKGFGEKTASIFLRMCGAEHLVPVDTIMAGILYLHGYPIEIKRFKANRKDEGKKDKLRKVSIKGKNYGLFENHSWDLAEKYGVSGHVLQLAFWTKHSTYAKLKKSPS